MEKFTCDQSRSTVTWLFGIWMGPRTQHLRCFLALEKKEKRFIIAVTFRRSRLLTAVCLCKIWIPAFNTTASMMSPSNHAHQVMHEERSCRTGGRARDTLFPWQTFRMPDLSFGMIIGQTAPNPIWPMRKRKPAPHDELEMPPTAELPEPVVAVHDKLKGLSLRHWTCCSYIAKMLHRKWANDRKKVFWCSYLLSSRNI